jgi:ribosomal protein S18 acetylase RimI-like enzyme
MDFPEERTSTVSIQVADPAGDDARWCLQEFFAELRRRSDAVLDLTRGTSAEPHELRPPVGAFLIAYRDGEPVGCGAVKHCSGEPSDIKRMWVAQSARGVGVGRRILSKLERLARDSGATAVRLETNKELVEAIALYRSSGYEEVSAFNDEPFAHHWFVKRLDDHPV